MAKQDVELRGLDLWNKLEVSDVNYTKKFDKGSFKGTAVDAIYNIKRVTELLGPVGFAWGWHITREEYRTYGSDKNEQVIHSCVVRAWFRQPDGATREVEHIGSTKAAYWTRGANSYLMVDEEAAKKSVTDALSKIMVSLGASADIWLGRFDGNKYVPPHPPTQIEPPPPIEEEQPMKELVTIVNADGEVLCTTSIWQEAVRRYGEIKKLSYNPKGVQRANIAALRKILPYTHNGMRDKLEAEIIVAENLPPPRQPDGEHKSAAQEK